MLAGLGTIGAASAVAGVGTYAAFSDEAGAEAEFTAGEIDARMRWSASYNGDVVDTSQESETSENDGPESPVRINAHPDENLVALDVGDLKPGDYGSIVFELSVETNPAWVFSCVDFEKNDDNGINDPERRAYDDGDDHVVTVDHGGPVDGETSQRNVGDGELLRNMLLIPFYDSNVDSNFFDGSPEDEYNSVGVLQTPTAFWSNADGDFHPRTVLDVVTNPLAQGTVNWNASSDSVGGLSAPIQDRFVGCVLLNGEQGGDTTNEQEFGPLAPYDPDDAASTTIRYGYDWHLPYDVGNRVQTDTLTLEFLFDFQQYRHNEEPTRPYFFNPGYGASSGQDEGDQTS